MKIDNCNIENFTVFHSAHFEFCKGINVIIGANGTGKSHLLKILYAMTQNSSRDLKLIHEIALQYPRYLSLMNGLFRPKDGDIGVLVRDSKTNFSSIGVCIDELPKGVILPKSNYDSIFDPSIIVYSNTNNIFIPTNEVLAIYPGFTASYEKRELAFDQTYYDICKALSATPLKKKSQILSQLQSELEAILQGSVVLKGDRFYVKCKDSKRTLEAHLIAEGHRKIAALVHLINNGSIDKDTLLFWDEPETNMNPRLIKHIADFLRGLSQLGIQIFITSHDFLLTNELSLAAEYKTSPEVPIRFFALSRNGDEPVKVQSGDTLADLSDNAILDEFAAHYSREEELVIQRMKMGEKNECNPRRES